MVVCPSVSQEKYIFSYSSPFDDGMKQHYFMVENRHNPQKLQKTDCQDESWQSILTGRARQRRILAGQVQENPG